MIRQTLEDILEGVEFEGSEASFCESECLWELAGWFSRKMAAYKLMADLRRCKMRPFWVRLALSHDQSSIMA
jgi:hypothetical protein